MGPVLYSPMIVASYCILGLSSSKEAYSFPIITEWLYCQGLLV
jgi:hypothetical protein